MEPSDNAIISRSQKPWGVPYRYQPINSDAEIRILELHPPDPHDPEALHDQLITAKLKDKPSYEAISYVLGEPIFSETLNL